MDIPTHGRTRLADHSLIGWLYGVPVGMGRDPAVLADLTPYARQLAKFGPQIGDELGDVAGVGLWPAVEVAPTLAADQVAGAAIDAASIAVDVEAKRWTWSRTVVARPLADLKAAKLAAAAGRWASLIADGFTWGGHVWQLGSDRLGSTGIDNITSMGAIAAKYLGDEPGWSDLWAPVDGFKFFDRDNVAVAMTAAEMFAFAEAAGVYVVRGRYRFRALKSAIPAVVQAEGEADEEAARARLAAIDVAAGWP